MNLSVGIVGFPNAGKSTLFNALLGRQIASTAPYPFCTIEPNVGVVPVPDERLAALAKTVNPEKITLAVVKFIDIAGLVKGAHKGEGLGNQFLSHIREVDVICFVLRAFENKDVEKAGSIDPKKDLENLKAELILKDLETMEKVSHQKENVQNIKEKQAREKMITKIIDGLNQGKMVKDIVSEEEEIEFVRLLNLLTFKPYFIILNVNEDDLREIESIIDNYKDWTVIPICAKVEEDLASLSPEDQKEYLKSLGLEKSGLERLIRTAYDYLGLISFLTAGPKEVRAWTIRKATKAPKAAGVIHSDFEKNFVRAKVIDWREFVDLGGWLKAAEKGKVRIEGRDYELRDGEVVEFLISK